MSSVPAHTLKEFMKGPSVTLVILAAVVFLLASGCSRNHVRRSIDQTVRAVDRSPKVVADYQPWFGDSQHIQVGYSTQDPNVLRRQIQQAKALGIYAFAVDWYGNRNPFLDRSYALLQQVASENHFHVALMYDETEEDNGHATEDALDAFDKAYRAYIGPSAPARGAYLNYQGRPVIFIFPKRGHTDWTQVRRQQISTAIMRGFILVRRAGARMAASGVRSTSKAFTAGCGASFLTRLSLERCGLDLMTRELHGV